MQNIMRISSGHGQNGIQTSWKFFKLLTTLGPCEISQASHMSTTSQNIL